MSWWHVVESAIGACGGIVAWTIARKVAARAAERTIRAVLELRRRREVAARMAGRLERLERRR